MRITLKRVGHKYLVTVNGAMYPFSSFKEALLFVFERRA